MVSEIYIDSTMDSCGTHGEHCAHRKRCGFIWYTREKLWVHVVHTGQTAYGTWARLWIGMVYTKEGVISYGTYQQNCDFIWYTWKKQYSYDTPHTCQEHSWCLIIRFHNANFKINAIFTKEMKLWCLRHLLCTLLRLNWAKQTPGIIRRN